MIAKICKFTKQPTQDNQHHHQFKNNKVATKTRNNGLLFRGTTALSGERMLQLCLANVADNIEICCNFRLQTTPKETIFPTKT